MYIKLSLCNYSGTEHSVIIKNQFIATFCKLTMGIIGAHTIVTHIIIM